MSILSFQPVAASMPSGKWTLYDGAGVFILFGDEGGWPFMSIIFFFFYIPSFLIFKLFLSHAMMG